MVDGQISVLEYERRPKSIVLLHTEVPESQRRRGIGSQLARFGVEFARAQGLRVVAGCPFVRAYLRKHPGLETSPE